MPRFRRPTQSAKAPRKPAAPFRCRLVVMAKVPTAGRVKTRLARQIGVAAATSFARHALATTLARLDQHQVHWHTILAVAPDHAFRDGSSPRTVTRIKQGPGDLGQRMQRIMDRTPAGPVVIVGTDIPHLRASHIRQAFALLGSHDAVFGPAADGGYWLAGLRRRPRVLAPFSRVRWSSPHALADTLTNLEGRTVAFLPTLSDVDDEEAWTRFAGAWGRRIADARAISSVGR